jgi:hypothetical protein
MTRRLAPWLVAAPVVLAALAVVVPGSPAYLPGWLAPQAPSDGDSVRAWALALDGPDPAARRQAVLGLGALGERAGEAVPALAKVLREDGDPATRGEAARALANMAPASRAAVPALAQALGDDEPRVRMHAALALAGLRGEARPAVPALARALDDEANRTDLGAFSLTIQEAAALALGRAGGDEAAPALARALRPDRPEGLRRAAARALGEAGAAARPAVPQLRALLTDSNFELRLAAAEALWKVERGQAADLELPEAERQYLWQVEHHGNLLVKHGFGPLAAALRGASAAELSRLLADDFAGADLREPHRVRAIKDYAEVERTQDAGRPALPLGRDAFVARLLELRKAFPQAPPRVKFALMTLGPQRRGQLDGRWEGTAQLRLHGEHAPGAPAEVVAVLRYEVPRPTEEALARPGWLRAAGLSQVHTAKAPRYLFAEVARQRGLDTSWLHDNWTAGFFLPVPGGVYVCDFDRDGFLDVLVTDANGCALYRGRPGGTFENVTAQVGLPGQLDEHGRPATAWVDIDGDGWEDLILGGRVYRNDRGRRFVDYTDRCNLSLPPDASGIVVADYDRDGKLDLYVTRGGRPEGNSWLDGRTDDARGNHLFRNKGGWQFEDVTRAAGASGGRRSTFTAAWLDADNDGWPDLHVLNEFGDGMLLVNNRDGTFRERALADRPADFGSMGLAVGDVNNDGHVDIFCANMYSKAGSRVIGNLAPDAYPPQVLDKMRRFVAGSQLHLNRGGLKFEQAGTRMQVAAVGWSYGACLADLDNDGWLDLYATAGYVSRNRDEPDG